MINVIIVEDEPLAQEILESYIAKMPQLNLLAKCANAIEASNALKEHDVDLIFLDIQMPQITGIEFLKSLSNPPLTIFTTALPNYAVEGFELDAVDYLVKPIPLERFMKAVGKAEDILQRDSNSNLGNDGEDFIFVKSDKKLIKIKYDDIIYIEGLKDYVIIRMANSKVITLQTMKSLEAKLPDNLFKRIHRSYIVAIDKIDALVGNSIEVTEKGATKIIPVGKNYKEEILKIINSRRI